MDPTVFAVTASKLDTLLFQLATSVLPLRLSSEQPPIPPTRPTGHPLTTFALGPADQAEVCAALSAVAVPLLSELSSAMQLAIDAAVAACNKAANDMVGVPRQISNSVVLTIWEAFCLLAQRCGACTPSLASVAQATFFPVTQALPSPYAASVKQFARGPYGHEETHPDFAAAATLFGPAPAGLYFEEADAAPLQDQGVAAHLINAWREHRLPDADDRRGLAADVHFLALDAYLAQCADTPGM
jgi:hypothetical protein